MTKMTIRYARLIGGYVLGGLLLSTVALGGTWAAAVTNSARMSQIAQVAEPLTDEPGGLWSQLSSAWGGDSAQRGLDGLNFSDRTLSPVKLSAAQRNYVGLQ